MQWSRGLARRVDLTPIGRDGGGTSSGRLWTTRSPVPLFRQHTAATEIATWAQSAQAAHPSLRRLTHTLAVAVTLTLTLTHSPSPSPSLTPTPTLTLLRLTTRRLRLHLHHEQLRLLPRVPTNRCT